MSELVSLDLGIFSQLLVLNIEFWSQESYKQKENKQKKMKMFSSTRIEEKTQ